MSRRAAAAATLALTLAACAGGRDDTGFGGNPSSLPPTAETCESCPQDCGQCPPKCGDASCNGGETCASCESDCCTPCPCKPGNPPDFDNVCHWPPKTQGCPPTFPGGYCDPNGDGSYQDGDWNKGYYEYHDKCL